MSHMSSHYVPSLFSWEQVQLGKGSNILQKMLRSIELWVGIILLKQYIVFLLQECQQNQLYNDAVQSYFHKHQNHNAIHLHGGWGGGICVPWVNMHWKILLPRFTLHLQTTITCMKVESALTTDPYRIPFVPSGDHLPLDTCTMVSWNKGKSVQRHVCPQSCNYR